MSPFVPSNRAHLLISAAHAVRHAMASLTALPRRCSEKLRRASQRLSAHDGAGYRATGRSQTRRDPHLINQACTCSSTRETGPLPRPYTCLVLRCSDCSSYQQRYCIFLHSISDSNLCKLCTALCACVATQQPIKLPGSAADSKHSVWLSPSGSTLQSNPSTPRIRAGP